MTFEEAAEALLSHPYRYAKSMPKHPHFYTLRGQWANEKEFEEVVQFIRDNSTTEYFYAKPYQMFYLNEHKYWTMGDAINRTILINKADHRAKTDYDKVAEDYSKLFQDNASRQEERDLMAKLDIKGRVLDIGCGTGLLLEYVTPGDYVGIDPSRNMLNILVNRFPERAAQVQCCPFEYFYGGTFDTIVSLFGSPSYIKPKFIERIPNMLNKGGKAFLVFYGKDYYPVTHTLLGIDTQFYPPKEPGEPFNNFQIVTYENL